ncbi:MAG: DUF2182 domain-containing protein [Pseudomonadota bacterium]
MAGAAAPEGRRRGGALEAALRRDRLILVAGVFALAGMAALYTLSGVGMKMSALEMTSMAGRPMGAAMMAPVDWTPGYAALVFLMWWVMMTAMMLPSAAPVILLHAALLRRSEGEARVAARSAVFAGGYLAAWAGFSLAAASAQWALELRGLVSPSMMAATAQGLSGLLLLAAGIWQVTPMKDACLSVCRSPAQVLAERRRPGAGGAFRMGLEHGAYCVGCCWALMALLFVGGVMNLWWIVGLAAYAALEKLGVIGELGGRAVGLVLIAWGAGLLVTAG